MDVETENNWTSKTLFNKEISSHHLFVAFHISFEIWSSLLLKHDVIFFHPIMALPVSLCGDLHDSFHFRLKVHLEPLRCGVVVWSPASLCVMKSSPGFFWGWMCGRYTYHLVFDWTVFHSQWFWTSWFQVTMRARKSYEKYSPNQKKVIACTEIFLYDDDCSNSSESMPNTRYINYCIITITQLMNENCCPIQDSKTWWYTNWIDYLIPFLFSFLSFRI